MKVVIQRLLTVNIQVSVNDHAYTVTTVNHMKHIYSCTHLYLDLLRCQWRMYKHLKIILAYHISSKSRHDEILFQGPVGHYDNLRVAI